MENLFFFHNLHSVNNDLSNCPEIGTVQQHGCLINISIAHTFMTQELKVRIQQSKF